MDEKGKYLLLFIPYSLLMSCKIECCKMKLFHFASKCLIKNFTLFYQSVLLYDKNVVTLQPILENYRFNNQRK